MSKEEQYKQLCEDLLRYVTKDSYDFVARYQAIATGKVETAPAAENVHVIPRQSTGTSPIPGDGPATSLDVTSVIKRTNDLVNHNPVEEEDTLF